MLADLLLAAALAAAPVADAPAAPLAPVTLEYEVLRNGDPMGVSTLVLAQDERGEWTLESRTKGTSGLAGLAGASIDERSAFAWREGHPELRHYRYAQALAWKDKRRELDVLPDARSIAYDDGKHVGRMPFEDGVMDRHMVVLAIARDVAAKAEVLEYRVADKDKLETHRYRIAGTERVTCRAGSFEATRVERVREHPGRTTTSWLAAETQWLPVKIVQREPDGETIEMRLKSLPR
ncbi:MAG TPA: DUF3108 domain-containing protein [Xanthomonadales bacterium]|nr:DUF3108 domain-containing protein [Xanthomonadales bacterium]